LSLVGKPPGAAAGVTALAMLKAAVERSVVAGVAAFLFNHSLKETT